MSQLSTVPAQQLPPLRPLPGAGDVVQQPLDLGAGEVGVDQKPRLLCRPARPRPWAFSSSQRAAVRRHCHTMAL